MSKWDIGFISTPHYLQALAGKKKFAKDPADLREKYQDIRSLFGMTSGFGQYVVRADSGIKTISDLKGKKVAIGQPGGGGATITPMLFAAHGLPKDAYTPQFLTASAALDEMRNNRNDLATVWGGLPQAAIYNFSRKIPIHFLSLQPGPYEDFKKQMPKGEFFLLRSYPTSELKKVYGKGLVQEADEVHFMTFQMQIVVRKDMPEDVAYTLVKAFWENLEEIKSTAASLSNINRKDSLESLSAELHPGAAKYYRERGWLE